MSILFSFTKMNINSLISKNIAIIVLIAAIIGLLFPKPFTHIPSTSISWLLGAVMFGMGLTLQLKDFISVFTHPKNVIIGCLAQFSIMPFLAWILCKVFHLPIEITIGVVLVGCCPGGTASNVITFLAKGDLALSVGMTSISTLLSPLATPFLIWLIIGEDIDVDTLGMILSIIKIVIIPIVLGIFIQTYFAKFTQKITPWLPTFSTLVIAFIVALVIAKNAQQVINSSLIVLIVVILHNLLGYGLGFLIGKCLKLSPDKRSAITIEVGMQNSGLACSLATTHFALFPMAAIPGALFSVWHNFSGAIMASILRKTTNNCQTNIHKK